MRKLELTPEELDRVVCSDEQRFAALNAAVELLDAKLKPGRLARVARRPAPAYGDRSMLDAVSAGDHEKVLAAARESFAWDRGA